MKEIKKLLKAQDYYGILEYLFEIEDETLLKNSIEYLMNLVFLHSISTR